MKRGFTLIETLICLFIISLLIIPTYKFIKVCSKDIEMIETKKRELNDIVSIYYYFNHFYNHSKVIEFYYEDGYYVIVNENEEKCYLYYDHFLINKRSYPLEVYDINENSDALLVFYNLNNKIYCFEVEEKDEESYFNR